MTRWIVVAAVLLAGCAEAPAPGGTGEEWYLGGAWTAEHTQADIDAWCEIARAYDNECLVMESYPPQFGLRFSSEARCEDARAEILALEHVTARACARIEPSDDPDAPTSSPVDEPPAGPWTLHGAFRAGYTQEDLDAWCALATELGQSCALMKSEPPQFAWEFASSARCEEARFRLQSVESVDARSCVDRTPAEATYDVRTFALTWSDGGSETHAMEWEVVRAWREHGLLTINVTTRGIEGGDFRFRLWATLQDEDAGGVLFHRPGGTEPGTFDFLYNESVFWRGEAIDHVDAVAELSHVRIESIDAGTGELTGTFHLDFTARCDGQYDCGARTGPFRRVLDGRFG